jgi:hypothetical protein
LRDVDLPGASFVDDAHPAYFIEDVAPRVFAG